MRRHLADDSMSDYAPSTARSAYSEEEAEPAEEHLSSWFVLENHPDHRPKPSTALISSFSDARTSSGSQQPHHASPQLSPTSSTLWKRPQTDDEAEATEHAKTEMPLLVLNPLATYRIFWDFIVMALVLENLLIVPLQLSFLETQKDKWQGQSTFTYVHLGIDCVFLVDIVLNFMTAYVAVNERGDHTMVVKRTSIVSHYLRTWFLVDFLGSIPLEFLLEVTGAGERFAAFSKIFKFFRLMKLTRVLRFGRFIGKLREAFDLNPAVIRASKMGSFFALLAHLLSCFFFFIGMYTESFQTCTEEYPTPCFCNLSLPDGQRDPKCISTTWLTESYYMIPNKGSQALMEVDIGNQYLVTMYWVMSTMTTVGFGDLKPVTQYEIWTCIIAQILGATTFGFIVGNMASLAEMLRGRAAEFREKMDSIMSFMQNNHIPQRMQKRVIGDFRHQLNHPVILVKKDIIDKVPEALAIDVAKSTYQDILEACPVFLGLNQSTRNHLYLRLQPFHCGPGDIIARTGDHSHAIVFILEGSVHISQESKHGRKTLAQKNSFSHSAGLGGEGAGGMKEIVATFLAGNFFGENCLLPGRDQMSFTAIAAEWCDLLRLDVRDIVKTVQSEQEHAHMRMSAKVRHENFSTVLSASSKASASIESPVGRTKSKQRLAMEERRNSYKEAAERTRSTFQRRASAAQNQNQKERVLTRSKSIKTVVKQNMSPKERELLDPIVATASAQREPPRWGDAIEKVQIENEMKRLQEEEADLKKMLSEVAPEVSETLVTLDSLDTKDAAGMESQETIEDRVFAILRRVKKLENMGRLRQEWIDLRLPKPEEETPPQKADDKDPSVQTAPSDIDNKWDM